MELNNAGVLVTGGGSGIGAALCRRFAADGAKVVVADLNGDTAKAVADEIGGTPLVADVGSAEANATMIAEATDAIGPIDLLALNAGVPMGGGVEASDAEWDLSWRVNVMAHVWAVRAWLPDAVERGGGYLLHTVSAAGMLTNLGAAPYSVTKHAALALAEWLSIHHAHENIRVSALCPQFVQTNMLDDFRSVPGGEKLTELGVKQPDEIAEAVAAAIAEERFLVLPHPEVAQYEQNRAGDRERWLGGMRKLLRSITQ